MKRTKMRLRGQAMTRRVAGTCAVGTGLSRSNPDGLRAGTAGVTSFGGRTLLAGTLAACVMAGGGFDGTAFGQTNGGAGFPGTAEASLPVKRFTISAGPLDEAIKVYEASTGLKVKTNLPAAALAGFTTHGVVGAFAEGEGLRLLLVGTGLQYRFENGAMIVGMQAREDVTVQAASTMPLSQFTEALKDTPQTITVVPEFVLKEQANTTLRDALRNVPGISLAAGEGGSQGDNLTIRGFSARNDIFMDGIRDFGSYYRDSFNYEQVEVLEGPAGIELGVGRRVG